MNQWFPFRVVPYGNAVINGGPREDWGWCVLSADDPHEKAVMYDCENEEKATAICAILNAAHSFIVFSKAHSGPYAVPHDPACADTQHDHTGSRYNDQGAYLGRWVPDHECPPCDCGAQALVASLSDGQRSE